MELPKETRGEIIALLKKSSGMTAGEIAQALDLHSMTVRQHLSILEREGYISHSREKIKRGRPTHVYRLTGKSDQLFPRNYEGFAVNLLDILSMMEGQEQVNHLLKCQVEATIEKHFKHIEGKNLEERVKMLAEFLDQEGYMVELEETPTAYILKEHNCALGAVAKKYRQLCQNEFALFRRLLNVPIERQCHMMTGDHCCSYKVNKSQFHLEVHG